MNKVFGLLMAAMLLALTGCDSGHSNDQGNGEAEQAVRIPVEVAAAQVGRISASYSSTATLEADGQAQVVPRIGGQIMELMVEEGDAVEAGDVLARIDGDRLRLELARAEAELSRLRQDFNRHQEMHERNLISTEAFERLKYEYEAQQAQVNLARLELSYADISAPIAGVVSERRIKVGNMVSTTEPVFVVTAMEPILATLHVPERELARLHPGQPAMLEVDAIPGEQFGGEIARISPVIDGSSGTFRVTVELRHHGGRLRPGMFGRFHIVFDSREEVVLVPVGAVMNEDGRRSVFVINGHEAQRRSVQIGYRNNGDYEITDGLEPGERVVVTGQASLRSGAEVQILGEDGAEESLPEASAEDVPEAEGDEVSGT